MFLFLELAVLDLGQYGLLRFGAVVVCRVPVAALGGVQGLMPLHSATASALLTSMLGLKPGSWGWLSEGIPA